MQAVNYSELRSDLKNYMDRVCEDHEPLIVTRRGHDVVMMSMEDFSAYKETAYLLKSPKNAIRLLESIAGFHAGEGFEKELLEPEQ